MRRSKLRLLREALDKLHDIICVLESLRLPARLYLTGGAAEDRLTATSDVDIVVALDHEPSFEEAVEIREKILDALEKAGIPPYLPVELHIVGPEKLKRYRTLKRLSCKKNGHGQAT